MIKESIKKPKKNINELRTVRKREQERCLVGGYNAGVEEFVSKVQEDYGGDDNRFVQPMRPSYHT